MDWVSPLLKYARACDVWMVRSYKTILFGSVADPFYFDMAPDPDSRIHFVVKRIRPEIEKKYNFFFDIYFFYNAKFSEKLACLNNKNTALINKYKIFFVFLWFLASFFIGRNRIRVAKIKQLQTALDPQHWYSVLKETFWIKESVFKKELVIYLCLKN